MIVFLRRFLVFQALLAWQGGFFFYAAVVVPIGTDLLGSAKEQGFITQRVTHWLNLLAVVYLALAAWDQRYSRGRTRWFVWLAQLLVLAALVPLHAHLDTFMDAESGRLARGNFYPAHAIYLWLSAAHWFLGLAAAALMLAAWTRPPEPSA